MLEGIKFEINHKIRQNKKWIFISFAIVFLGVTAFCVVNLVNNIDNNKFKSEYSDYIRLVEEGDSLAKLMKYDDTLNVYKVAKEEVKATNVINGHEYVDLGLPSGLKWASCNIGASAPDAFGNYYAWGELNVKAEYSPNTSTTMSKQMKDISSNPQYDVANATWGESWRMPTEKELYELINVCTWTWTTQNGVEGYKVTGPNGNSIFLPVAGYRYWSSLRNVRSYGYYWASSPYQNDYAYCLYFSVKGHGVYSSNRYRGQSVRPVTE